MLSMTADELGITGPHIVAHTLDGPVVVEEVESYYRRRDTGQRYALIQCRLHSDVTAHLPVPVKRLEVRA